MDKNISSNSIKDSFSLIINSIVDEKNKKSVFVLLITQ